MRASRVRSVILELRRRAEWTGVRVLGFVWFSVSSWLAYVANLGSFGQACDLRPELLSLGFVWISGSDFQSTRPMVARYQSCVETGVALA